MEAHFHLVEVDMHEFFTVRADFSNLTIKVDRVSAARATCDYDADDSRLMLHVTTFLSIGSKMIDFR
jgi:hypothetical protein